jgi:hypothetical protein
MNVPGSGSGASRVAKAIWIVLAIIAVCVLSWLLFTALFPTALGWSVYRYAVDRIVGVSGWDRLLVHAIAILLLLPFVWAVGEIIRIGLVARVRDAWRGRHPLVYRKRAAATLLVAYTSAFFTVLYVAGRDSNFSFSTGEARRFYAVTPEGIRLFSEEGTDPKYGIDLRPITPEIAESVEREQLGLTPEPIPSGQLPTFAYFDGNTGRARAWFFETPTGVYELFSSAGFHPQYGEPLRPVTAHVVDAALAQLATDQAEAEVDAASAQAEADARASAERERRQADERAALRQRYLGGRPPSGVWLAVTRNDRPDSVLAARVQQEIGSASVFSDAFVTDGVAARLQQGQVELLEQLGLRTTSRVLLIDVRSETAENVVAGERLVRCDVTLTIRSFEPASGTLDLFQVTGIGSGFDAERAERQAIERATTGLGDRLRV